MDGKRKIWEIWDGDLIQRSYFMREFHERES